MKDYFTKLLISNKKGVFAVLFIILTSFSFTASAHQVDSYTASCNGGPQYVVTAAVSNVNSTSNYRWQWKNTSGVWVCFVNGSNTINGNAYNVSGSVYNLTTSPGPIVFTNPSSGLQGLEIRMVISDGSGVNPCTLPSGNTWTSTTNHFINVTNTACASANSCSCPGNVVLNPSFENGTTSWSWGGGTLSAGNGAVACGSFSGDFQITNNSSNWVSQTIGTDLPVGTVINASVYAGTHDNSIWHGVIIDFFDANWNWISNSAVTVNKVLATAPAGPQLYTWSGVVPANCKYTNIGFSGSGGWIKTDQWCVTTTQPPCTGKVTGLYFNKLDGGTDLPITNGAIFTVAQLGSLYNLEASTTGTIGSVKFTITGPTATSNIENTIPYNSPATGAGAWTGAVGTYTVNAKTYNSANGAGALCHDTTFTFVLSNGVSLGNQIFNDVNDNGIKDANETGWPYGMTVNLYQDNNNDGIPDAGWVVQTTNADGNGFYQFTGLVPGNYFVTLTNPYPVDWQKSSINGGNPNNNIDNDNNGLTGTSTIKGGTITLALGTEPDGVNINTDTNNTYDFGMWKGNGLGDFVFLDANANGIQDAGEVGIPNVTVTLSKGTNVYTTTTDANGYYFFADLYDVANGGYSLTFTTPAGFTPSPANQGTDDTIDSDPIGGVISGVQVPIGTWNHTFDAGFIPINLSLGNTVWYDQNNDGIKQATEQGVPNVTVNLYLDANNDNVPDGAAIATTTTNAAGIYGFSSLAAGNYIVGIITPSGYQNSSVNGGDPDNNIDLDNNGVNVIGNEIRGLAITLSPGTEPDGVNTNTNTNNTYDFGITGKGSIGDFVWYDVNGNGIQDAGEAGIPNATVVLTYPNGTTVTTTTNASGIYNFPNLAPGTYSVAFTTPSGLTSTTPNVGGNTVASDQVDSDPIGGIVSGIVLAAGQNNTTIDAGYYKLVNVGNTVWYDQNNDGIKQATETGIAGATVNLYLDANFDNVADGAAIATTTTSATGIYNFGSLAPGNYIVGVIIPTGYAVSATTATSANPNNDTDNDNNGVNTSVAGEVRSNAITLTSDGEPDTPVDGDGKNGNLTLDFGLKGTGSIGDFVWNDVNANGIQDITETGINGVAVTLTYPNGATVSTTTATNGATQGYYNFPNLAPGTYSVAFTTPTGYSVSPSKVTVPGATDANDSDPIGGVVSGITLTAGQVNNNIDAGFYLCTLANVNFNGPTTICAGEAAVFTAVGQGSGSVYNWTFMNGTPATAVGSSVSSSWNTPGEYNITLTVTKFGCTASVTKSIVITASVFANAGPDKDICSGSTATLGAGPSGPNGSGPVGSTYSWTVIAGDPTSITNGANQSTVLVTPNQTTTYQLTVTQNGCTRTDQVVVFINVNKKPTANAGPDKITLVGTGVSIGGNPTGTPPLATPGAALGYIWSPATNLNGTTITNPVSTPTAPGITNYRVIVYSILTGCSDTAFVKVTAIQPVNVGNNVWYDRNNNGIKDAGEPAIVTTVNLYKDDNADNIPDGTAIATTTSTGGVYNFTNLYPGNYIVGVTVPAGYAPSATTANSANPNTDIDNDNNGVNLVGTEVRTNTIILTAGGEPDVPVDGDGTNGNLTIDFGLKGTGSIGDFVWYDNNRNGLQDAGEPGINNVLVTLTSSDGTTVTTTTDANGAYSFPNLAPDTYSVTFATPAGMVAAPSKVTTNGGNDTNDSDPVNGVVSNIVLTAGQVNNNIDAGFNNSCSSLITGNVWHDINGMDNGYVDSVGSYAAIPIPNALKVSLVSNATGKVIKTSLVSGIGRFSFLNVAPGSYYIVLSTTTGSVNQDSPAASLPTGWKNTGEKLGTGPGRDLQVNGILNVAIGYECVSNANFGIKFNNKDIGID